MKKKNQLRGSIMLLLCSMFWGLGFTAQTEVAKHIGTFTCGALRFYLAAIALVGVVTLFDKIEHTGRSLFDRNKNPITKKEIRGGVICGCALCAASAFQQAAVGTAGPGKSAFITTLYVILVPIAGAVFFKRKLSPIIWGAVGAALVGVGLISLGDGFTAPEPADLLLFCSAICWCLHITTVDLNSEGCDGVRLSLVQMVTTATLNLILALIFEDVTREGLIGAVLPVLYLGLISGATSFTLQILGQKECPPAPAAILMSAESLFGLLGGILLLHETHTVREYIGCAVVFIAMLTSQIPGILQKKKEALLPAENKETVD